jgi:acetoin utilization protein AcuB
MMEQLESNQVQETSKGDAMLVRDRMSHPVITVTPQTTLGEALRLMNTEHIRRLPVVDKNGNLIGIVSERQLLKAAPTDATLLDVWEVKAVLHRVTIERIMTRDVITIEPETPIEEAARIMADSKISGIPVVEAGQVVGVITETDLFKAFLEVMGAREPGIRVTVLMSREPGSLSRLTGAIFNAGGNIHTLGTFLGESSENGEITLKVENISQEALVAAITPQVIKVLDIRAG